MSVTSEPATSPARTAATVPDTVRLTAGLSARTSWLILAAHVPFVLLHFGQLWRQRPHYEFFPFVVVAAVWMFIARSPPAADVQHTRFSVTSGWFLLMAGWVFLIAENPISALGRLYVRLALIIHDGIERLQPDSSLESRDEGRSQYGYSFVGISEIEATNWTQRRSRRDRACLKSVCRDSGPLHLETSEKAGGVDVACTQ